MSLDPVSVNFSSMSSLTISAALSKATGVPQPKVYDTLRRLVDRGAAVKVAENPATYVARPTDELLAGLEADFEKRLEAAKTTLGNLTSSAQIDRFDVLWRLDDRGAILDRAESLISQAEQKVYLSAHADELEPLMAALRGRVTAGVQVVVLHFGDLPWRMDGLYAYRHTSTDGRIFPHHQSRHLALEIDNCAALWALAPQGSEWTAVVSHEPHMAHLVKNYIRHDIFVQRIYVEFKDELHAVFGPGLEELATLGGTLFAARSEDAGEIPDGQAEVG